MPSALLRVIQEALTDAYRHAAASRLIIDLQVGADTLKLRVLDDGCGLSRGVRKAAEGGALLGVGVTGMRPRMVRFGGSLRLLSDARGTLVVATVPLGFASDLRSGREPAAVGLTAVH